MGASDTRTILILERVLLIRATAFDGLATPTVWLPKFMGLGLTESLACAVALVARSSANNSAHFTIFLVPCPVDCIGPSRGLDQLRRFRSAQLNRRAVDFVDRRESLNYN